jgi:hypothetical protein
MAYLVGFQETNAHDCLRWHLIVFVTESEKTCLNGLALGIFAFYALNKSHWFLD